MSDDAKKQLLSYGLTVLLGLALGVLIFSSGGGFHAESAADVVRCLSDAFTVPGIIFLAAAGLMFAAGDGFFDGISYAFRHALPSVIPGLIPENKHVRYGEYVQEQREKAKDKPKKYPVPFFTGLGFLAVAVILIVVFYQLS